MATAVTCGLRLSAASIPDCAQGMERRRWFGFTVALLMQLSRLCHVVEMGSRLVSALTALRAGSLLR